MNDLPLWIIVAAFAIWELYAHFIGKNKEAHTLSNRIVALQHRHPRIRVLTATVCLLLALHLTVQWI